jgi:hypothetical protein
MPYASLESLVVNPVTHIVSLGWRCATAYNLRRFFDFQTANLFDWWIMSDSALENILGNLDIEYLYNPSNLVLSPTRHTVIHSPSGALFHHEFPRKWNVPGQPVTENFEDHIDKPKKRSAYLMNRLRQLNKKQWRVLFVREGRPQSTVIELLSTLYPEPLWSVAFIRSPEQRPPFDWKCDPAEWDTVLMGLSATLEPGRHRRFEFRGIHQDDDS